MRTISQAAELSGISVRTLQYYDKIGLLHPTEFTRSGYRLYDEEALQKLQQILFFKELGFKLKEIDELLKKPDFDRLMSFKKQKELLLLKRNRTDKLIQLLSRLEKGEPCMSFKEFDLSEYIEALENFKNSSTEHIIQYFGGVENFNLFIQKAKADECKIAQLAIQEYGSIEKYTEAMKYNLEHFSELMEKQRSGDAREIVEQSEHLYRRLTSDLSIEFFSDEIQDIVQEIMDFIQKHATVTALEEPYWKVIIQSYSNDYIKAITDTKYGPGASEYIVKAFRYYSENNPARKK